jgi:hypothetical protein
VPPYEFLRGKGMQHERPESAAPPAKRKRAKSPVKTEPSDSDEDQKASPRHNRLLKNREAAQQFRQRQKTYIQDLEQKIEELTTSNMSQGNRAEKLETENKLLKEQVEYLRGFVTQLMASLNPMGMGMGMGMAPNFPMGLANNLVTPQPVVTPALQVPPSADFSTDSTPL